MVRDRKILCSTMAQTGAVSYEIECYLKVSPNNKGLTLLLARHFTL
jgi:hypothetical protein